MSDLQLALDRVLEATENWGNRGFAKDVRVLVDAARKYALTVTCSTCSGTGSYDPPNVEFDGDPCPTCKGQGQHIREHVIEAAARKMYAEVGIRNSASPLTYDIAYPDEQADFLRVAEKMLWASIGAAALDTESAE